MRPVSSAIRIFAIVTLVLGLVSCHSTELAMGKFPPVLRGAVHWSQASWRTSAQADWRTAATVGDIQTNGTVALIDPTTNVTLLATQASGATGDFTFPFGAQGVSLAPGFYGLEAVRFLSGERNAGVTLRTIVRYTGSGWDSISGTDIQVSPLTTAIARVRTLDPAVTDAATMHVVVPTQQLLGPLGEHAVAEIQQLAVEVEAAVTAGGDGAGDLPLAATVLPVRGTPGITLLRWSGMPLTFDFIRQLSDGVDALGTAFTDDAGAGQTAENWVAVAPAGMVGPVQMRLQKGTAHTAPVSWTPITSVSLGQPTTDQLVTATGPAGPVAVWSSSADHLVGSSRVDLQACKLEYSIVSPK